MTIVVLGNKLDKQDERRVDANMAQNWAKNEKVRLWEVSVVDRRTLIEPFVYLASKMTQPQSKSTFPLSRNKNKGSGSTDSWMSRHCGHVQEGGNRENVKGNLVLLKNYFDIMKDWGSERWWEKAGWLYVYLYTVSTVCIGIASMFDVLVNYKWVKMLIFDFVVPIFFSLDYGQITTVDISSHVWT